MIWNEQLTIFLCKKDVEPRVAKKAREVEKFGRLIYFRYDEQSQKDSYFQAPKKKLLIFANNFHQLYPWNQPARCLKTWYCTLYVFQASFVLTSPVLSSRQVIPAWLPALFVGSAALLEGAPWDVIGGPSNVFPKTVLLWRQKNWQPGWWLQFF